MLGPIVGIGGDRSQLASQEVLGRSSHDGRPYFETCIVRGEGEANEPVPVRIWLACKRMAPGICQCVDVVTQGEIRAPVMGELGTS